MTRTYYDVLGVDPDVDRIEIQRAYREQIRRYHPDASDRPDARERVKEINRAREVLADPAERERYDRLGHAGYVHETGRAPPGTPAGNAGADGGATGDAGGATAGAGDGDRRPDEGPAAAAFDDQHARAWTGPASEHAGATDTGRRAVEGETRATGPFASREVVSAVLLAGLVGAAVVVANVYLRTVAPAARPVDGSVLFVLLWAGVAVIAGELAAGGAGVLPRHPLRAYAFPAGLVAAAWVLRAGAPAVAALLGLYAAYTAVFRASAAVGRGRRSLVPAAVWFAGTVAPALALYDRLYPVGGLGRDVGQAAVSLAAGAGHPVSAAVASPLSLAVAVPLAVALTHALLAGLGRPLLSALRRLRARAGAGSDSAGGAGSPPPSGGPG